MVITDNSGRQSYIKRGDIFTARSDGDYDHEGSVFTISKENLRKHFMRVYTVEETNRYERIRENAMIAAMQSMIEGLGDKPVSPDMHEIENIPKNAIWFADQLVEELKKKEL